MYMYYIHAPSYVYDHYLCFELPIRLLDDSIPPNAMALRLGLNDLDSSLFSKKTYSSWYVHVLAYVVGIPTRVGNFNCLSKPSLRTT